MKKHVLLTGEIGAGKSVALARTLLLLGDVRVGGVQTYYPEPRSAQNKTLYLRAWGDTAQGELLLRMPDGDMRRLCGVFDGAGCRLIGDAAAQAQLVVIDEIGRLEREATAYQAALRALLDGEVPVLAVVRKHKAPWADWVRRHPKATLLEVTPENRDQIPQLAASLLTAQIRQGK